MKARIPAISVVFVILFIFGFFFFAGCSGARYDDGIYFAQEEGFSSDSGWKSVVTLTVDGDRIVAADWNGAHFNAGADKKTASKTGMYPMVANGGARSDWHVQAEAAESYLLKTQDPAEIKYIDEEGHTDAIAGVSIHVSEFFTLAEKALAAGPVGTGQYLDGAFHAEDADFASSGWKSTADFTVVNGYIVAVNWNGLNKEGGDDKKTVSRAGGYPMVTDGGARSDWHVQAEAVEVYFLADQGTPPSFSDNEGHTDDIASVTIHVADLYNLALKALKTR